MVYLVNTDAEIGARHHASLLGLIWLAGRVAPYRRRWFGINTDRRWFVEVQIAGRYVGVCWG